MIGNGGDIVVEGIDLARSFDVSKPWLDRFVSRMPRRVLHAVDGVSFCVRRGETLALVGESGCGKSTLARMCVGLLPPSRGSVAFEGMALYGDGVGATPAVRRRARASMQMIFQDPYASLNPRWRVFDLVGEPIAAAEPGIAARDLSRRVTALLDQVGLSASDAQKYPHQFSGGQRQRISIARALSTRPAFIACDEPTSALDVSVQAQVLNLMRDLQRQLGLAYLFISHNLAVVHHIADRVGVMYLGRVVESADRRTLFGHARHPYTQMLLDAVPDLEHAGTPAEVARGEVPDPLQAPAGCSFHPRCPYADARCEREVPQLAVAGDGHRVACHAVAENRIAARHALPPSMQPAMPLTFAALEGHPGIPL